MILLECLLVVRSVPGQISLNRSDRNLKLVRRPLKKRCGKELPGKAASWISLIVVFHHIFCIFSVNIDSCHSNVFVSRC